MIFGESAVVKVGLAYVSRGSKSRNKVSVGEPAEGSVSANPHYITEGVRALCEVEEDVGGG